MSAAVSKTRNPRPGGQRKATPVSRRNPVGASDIPLVLRCLFQEHKHLSALARALEQKAQQAAPLGRGDYYLMRDILGYLHDYPDHVHHPTENRLFDLLKKRVPSQAPAVKRLLSDHQAVEQETQSLLDLLDQAIEESSRERERAVREACAAFVSHQRAHMQFENQQMFPAAIEALTAADWKQIEKYFEATDDPLFGQTVGKKHRLLYEYLLDPVNQATGRLAVSRLFSLELLLRSVDIVEQSHSSAWRRINQLGAEMTGETRQALNRALKPASLGSFIGLPFNYAAFLGKSVIDCSGDLLRISAATAKDTLALFSERDPDV
jgi:hemerythrin-like domain-containing protein